MYLICIWIQIHIKITNKRQSIASHSLTGSRDNVFHTCGRVNSGQVAVRKLAYSEGAGQISTAMNKCEASEAITIHWVIHSQFFTCWTFAIEANLWQLNSFLLPEWLCQNNYLSSQIGKSWNVVFNYTLYVYQHVILKYDLFLGQVLPYPPGVFGAEMLLLFVLAGLEAIRLFFGEYLLV